ncbi:MAG: hypothetical protein SLRJCFUN_000974 [Candidatus Fervidibacter sp.]
MRSQRGFALVLVLALLVLLTLLAAGLAFTVRSEVNIASDFADQLRARYLAQAGFYQALQQLMQDDFGVDSPADTFGELRSQDLGLDFDDGQFIVRITDETGKLNLNTADRATLVAFFTQVTGDGALAEELADSILDWRDSDDNPNPQGAESDYYLRLPQPYRAKNAPFDSPYELLLVKGMTRELFYGDPQQGTPPLTELVTAFSATPNVDERGQPRINLNTATREQLQAALGDILTADEIDALLRFRDGTGQQRPQSGTTLPRPPIGQPPSTGGQRPPFTTSPSPPVRPPAPSSGFLPPQSNRPPSSVPPSPTPRPSRGVPAGSLAQPPAPPESPAAPLVAPPEPQQLMEPPRPSGQSGQGQRRRFQSPLDLLQVLPREKVIAIWERVTTTDSPVQYGLVNLNTAPPEVLSALLPDNPAAVDDILAYRQQNGRFQSVGELLNLSSLTQTQLRQLVNRVCVKSGTFRLRALGIVGNRRVVHLIDAIVERLPATLPTATMPTATGTTAPSEQNAAPVQFVIRYWRER